MVFILIPKKSLVPVTIGVLIGLAVLMALAVFAYPAYWRWSMSHEVWDRTMNSNASHAPKPRLYFFTHEGSYECIKMNRVLVGEPEKARFLSENFDPIQIISDQGPGNAIEVSLRKNLSVRTSPLLVVTLPNGAEVRRLQYFQPPDVVWKWLQETQRLAQVKMNGRP